MAAESSADGRGRSTTDSGGAPAHGPQRVLNQIRQLSPSKPFYGRVALALTVVLVAVLYRPTPPEKVPFPVMALSTWRSPTESLLHSPADPLLKSVPRLGEKFFETKPAGDKNDQ